MGDYWFLHFFLAKKNYVTIKISVRSKIHLSRSTCTNQRVHVLLCYSESVSSLSAHLFLCFYIIFNFSCL